MGYQNQWLRTSFWPDSINNPSVVLIMGALSQIGRVGRLDCSRNDLGCLLSEV